MVEAVGKRNDGGAIDVKQWVCGNGCCGSVFIFFFDGIVVLTAKHACGYRSGGGGGAGSDDDEGGGSTGESPLDNPLELPTSGGGGTFRSNGGCSESEMSECGAPVETTADDF